MKHIAPNYKGIITFIEDRPLLPNDADQHDTVIIEVKVTPEIAGNLDRIIIYFKLGVSFFFNNNSPNLNRRCVANLKYDYEKSKYYCSADGIKLNCELFKKMNTVHVLGYIF